MYLVTAFASSQHKVSAESYSIVVNSIEESIKYMYALEATIKEEYGMEDSEIHRIYEEWNIDSWDYRKKVDYIEQVYYLHIKPVWVLVNECAWF